MMDGNPCAVCAALVQGSSVAQVPGPLFYFCAERFMSYVKMIGMDGREVCAKGDE